MGPRLRRRGSPCSLAATATSPPWLQWGHGSDAVDHPLSSCRPIHSATGFNGATAQTPWITALQDAFNADPDPKLQWGHGSDAVDHPVADRLGHVDDRASMGPRLRRR